MIQALFVWHESSQLLVQRRYSEMQQSVVANLDNLYYEFYKPKIQHLARQLAIEIPVEGSRFNSETLGQWLNLNNCKSLYGSDCVLMSKIRLSRETLSFPQKLKKLCQSLKNPRALEFTKSDRIQLLDHPQYHFQDCSSPSLTKIIDKIEFNEGISNWTKFNHPIEIFNPILLSKLDKIHGIYPWNIFSHFMLKNSYFLWMGGNNGLGNSMFKPSARINILGGYRDLNWHPDYSFSALDYELIWSHEKAAKIFDFVSGKVKEPKVFNYILFKQKDLAANYISHVSSILRDEKLPDTVHPQYFKLIDELKAKINVLLKRHQGVSVLGLKDLISLSREEWRSKHLDVVLKFSQINLNEDVFSDIHYIKQKNLLNYKVFFGVDSELLFKEVKLANWLIILTLCMSLLILCLIIFTSFKILPHPIQNLVAKIKSIKMDALLSQRLNFQKPNLGDEIKTLENSFQLMKSELGLQFRQLHFIRVINYQILNKKPLEETLKVLVDYIASCLPNRPYGLGIYYYQSARQSSPTNFVQYGSPIDTSIIKFSESQFEGTVKSEELLFNWYRISFSESKLKTSSYILMTVDRNSLGFESDDCIRSFISTVLEQLQTLLYQTILQQIQKDNEIASQLQQGILAPVKIINPYIQICADMRSAGYLGGDFFTVIERNNQLLFGIADVTSKGIAPALVGNCARSLIHYFSNEDSADILNKVNKSLIGEGLAHQHFVTCFMGTLDERLQLHYVAAGHQMMIHVNTEGNINYLNGPNIPLGLDIEQIFKTQFIQLQPGDLIFLYTDGIPELQNDTQEIFSQKRLEQLIVSLQDKSAQEIEHIIYSEISAFVGNRGLSDDVTTVIIKV